MPKPIIIPAPTPPANLRGRLACRPVGRLGGRLVQPAPDQV